MCEFVHRPLQAFEHQKKVNPFSERDPYEREATFRAKAGRSTNKPRLALDRSHTNDALAAVERVMRAVYPKTGAPAPQAIRQFYLMLKPGSPEELGRVTLNGLA
jgi:hypothetical protein